MRLMACLLLVLFIPACEQRTVVDIEGGNPPTFIISGSGKLGELIVFGPEQERISDPFDTTYAIWRIVPDKSGAASLVRDLGKITYGVVPQGYKQITPESTAPLAQLTSGKRYRYWFVTVNAPHAGGYFEIQDGKAVIVQGR